METAETNMTNSGDQFNQQPEGLPIAVPTPLIDLNDGDTFEIVAAPVRKQIGDTEVRLLAYNGSVPGPTLRLRQGSTVTVNFTNQIDLESTIHWHGLRIDNRYDGTHETQVPVPVGGRFAYRVNVPDPGIYWYHPHIREDYGQEMGLYGNVLVVPAEAGYWPPVHREIALTLDDILIEDNQVASFSRSTTTHTAMGRFGNILLVGGEPSQKLRVRRGEVVRFYLTNTANTRVFHVAVAGGRMKLIGGDSGRCEREQFVDAVVISPSERVVVDVFFAQPGQAVLEHRTPDRTYQLATITVSDDPAPTLSEPFEHLRSDPELVAERQGLAIYLDAAPAKTLAFVAEMKMGDPEPGTATVYACPMHPEVVSDTPGRCPKCGMTLLPIDAPPAPASYSCPMHPDVVSDEPGRCPKCGMKLMPTTGETMGHATHDHGHQAHDEMHAGHEHHADHATHAQHEHHGDHAMHGHEHHQSADDAGHRAEHQHDPAFKGIEWEDDMVEVNRMTTPANMRWLLVDRSTGAENHAIDWQFRVGQRVKIRLVNEMDSDHPMHHPFHIHGAGRFLVLSRNGNTESNLMWKDTVLVRTGETVDILLDVTNPGIWMAHCHIAEHHESGMMFSFHVQE
jgi:FtsP/CotA-like multicopper oxidase with cupredoxin domain